MGPAFVASFMKLFGLCTLFLPVAVLLGFREAELIAILVMLGSSTTVSSYVMARNMGHSGVLSSALWQLLMQKCIFPDVLAVCAEDAGTDLKAWKS
ncbi:MAG: hypothetical protein ACLUD2_02330 [Clostridium sp.]